MILALLETAITLTGEGDLSVGRLGQPTTIAVDATHDLTDRIAVALVSSRYAMTNMRASAGGGFCVYGNAVCDVGGWDDIGGEAHYALRDDVRATGGLVIVDSEFGVKLAARVHRTFDRLTVFAHPTLIVPRGMWLPLGIEARPIDHLVLGVHTGVMVDFDAPSDWELPLAGTLAFESKHVTFGASFAWYRLASGIEQLPNRAPEDGFDYRIAQFWIGATW